MKKIFIYIIVLSVLDFSTFLYASTSSVYGRVIDKATGKPIPNTNIYLANTTIGTTTNEKGYFEIKDLPQGTFDIIFSHVAYYFHKKTIVLKHYYIDVGTIRLMTKAYQLPTVIVEDEEGKWKDQYEKFVNEFIGEGNNSDSTYIVDPYNIDFWEKDDKLFASCNDPIDIVNRSLGYEIKYFLDYFESCSKYTKYSGNAVFTSIPAHSKSDSIRWVAKRKDTYIGSFRHFLNTLNNGYSKYEKSLEDRGSPQFKKKRTNLVDLVLNTNGFFIYQVRGLQWEEPFPITEVPMPAQKLLRSGDIKTERYLQFTNYLKIYYIPDYEENKYPPNYRIKNIPNVQSSYLSLVKDSVMVDIHGRYYDKFGIHTFGKFGQERVSDMLPYEYEYKP